MASKYDAPKLFDSPPAKLLEQIDKVYWRELGKALDALEGVTKKIDGRVLEELEKFSAPNLEQLAEKEKKLEKDCPAEYTGKVGDKVKQVRENAQDWWKELDRKKGARTADENKAYQWLAQLVAAAAIYEQDLSHGLKVVKDNLSKQRTKLEKEGDGEDEADERELAQVGSRIAAALKIARDSGGGREMQFRIATHKNDVFVYVAKSVTDSIQKNVKDWMGLEENTAVGWHKGQCVFAEGAHTFIGATLPTGSSFATKLQKALLELTGKRFKIATARRKDDVREVVEAEGDDADDMLDFIARSKGPDASRARKLQEELKRWQPQLQYVLETDGALARQAKQLLLEFDAVVAKSRLGDAERVLRRLTDDVFKETVELLKDSAKDEKEYRALLARLEPRIKKAIDDQSASSFEVKRMFGKVKVAEADAPEKERKLESGWDIAKSMLEDVEELLDKAEGTIAEKNKFEAAMKKLEPAIKKAKDAGDDNYKRQIKPKYQEVESARLAAEKGTKKEAWETANKLLDELDELLTRAAK